MYLGFIAGYTIGGGAARINAYRAATVQATWPLSTSTPSFEITRPAQAGSLPAYMALSVVYAGAGSGTTRLVFHVQNRAASTKKAGPMVHNPLIPGWFDLLWIGAAALYVVLAVIAVVLVWRKREKLDTPRTLIWCLVAFAVPAIFLVVWFIAGPKPEEPATNGSAQIQHHNRQTTASEGWRAGVNDGSVFRTTARLVVIT